MTSANTSQYPEHDKLQAVQQESQAIGDFLEWLMHERGLHLAEWRVELDPEPCFEVVKEQCRPGHRQTWRVRERDPLSDNSWAREHGISRWDSEDEARAIAGRREALRRASAENNPRLRVAHYNVQDLLAEHFGIDRRALEREKRAMLAALRAGA